MFETHLLLARRKGMAPDAFASALAEAAPGHSLALLMPADTLPALAHVGSPDPALPDAILTLPEGCEIPAVEGYADVARSRVLVARRHAILPGGNAIRLVFALRRLPRLTLAAFHDYWLNRHADIGRRLIPPYTYHQLHADPACTATAAARTGLTAADYDGIVEVHFPDVEAFVRQLSRPEVAGEALADERNFIDHARSLFWAYRTA